MPRNASNTRKKLENKFYKLANVLIFFLNITKIKILVQTKEQVVFLSRDKIGTLEIHTCGAWKISSMEMSEWCGAL